VTPDPDDASLAAAAGALVAYPEAGALERELTSLGFAPVAGTIAPATPPLSAEDVLTAYGRVTGFDTETGQWPNEHDGLLAELAALASPALDGVVFEEIHQVDHASPDPYILHAYADGNRYRLAAQNLGDWYDVEAVLGLLNAILVARKSEVRLVTLPTGDQTAAVLAGPRAGIAALVKRRLIAVAAPGEGEAAGKEFEDQVIEQLQREGQDVQRDVPIEVP
jgi:hypothetical protein